MERNVIYLLAMIVIVLSCNGQKKMATGQDAQNDEKMILVDQNNYSGADSTETMVITDAKALKSFYAQVNRTRKPGLPVPEIDFSQHVVVIYCSSDENFTETERLAVVKETDSEMVLGMSGTSENDKDEPTSESNYKVSPFFVYKMPLTDKKISVKKIK